MGANVELSGSAYLTSGVIDLREVGELAEVIVEARHAFEMTPAAHEEGWRVKIQIHLQGEKSLTLIQKLKATGRFGN
ncbi:hypothetical protein [Streptomyces stelliscabiei]|uniref:hypothetical protein n=1 Tax=Streptomyces stelliscabiei TaxID=146820 RepID=UPI0029B9EFF8|nr:hypothetical protein [Streptomyces stelliscabiei]MDX2552738.1 hypothetical protein [Streptomyces stelliscabiei]